jgi:hypothetical protein
MLVLILSLVLAQSGSSAKFDPRDDYARRQRVQQSAEAWFRREVAPAISGRPSLREIRSFGVTVKENSNVLPPDLGGPRPGSPVEVTVQVFISGTADDYRWGQRAVQCRISQRLLAKNNGRGLPDSIRPNQPLRTPLACASGTNGGDNWGRPRPGYPWGR